MAHIPQLLHITKNPHITSAMLSQLRRKALQESGISEVRLKFAKWAYYRHTFPKLGLWRDDVTDWRNPINQKALELLPQTLLEERLFRICRAESLSISKTELPKSEWTQWEDDVEYLTIYAEVVKQEMKQKKNWLRQS